MKDQPVDETAAEPESEPEREPEREPESEPEPESESEKECSGGRRYTECGSACIRTCDQQNVACTRQCVRRCQCPGTVPIWHNNRCISPASCPNSELTCLCYPNNRRPDSR